MRFLLFGLWVEEMHISLFGFSLSVGEGKDTKHMQVPQTLG